MCPFGPPAEYAALRASEPIKKVSLKLNGRQVWLVTRYDHVRQVLSDPAISANMKAPGFPLQLQIPDEMVQAAPLTLFHMDPPVHTVHRRMVIPEFTVRRMEALRPHIQRIVDDRISSMIEHGAPADLSSALAVPVPLLVMCELLGVPYADREDLRRWGTQVTARESTPEQQARIQQEMGAYLAKLVAEKDADPADDLISRLILKNREENQLELADITSLALVLIAAGQSTANMISLGTLALLEHPERLAELKADPSLMGRAVDELARVITIADTGGTSRVATADIEVGGVVIKAGDGVMASLNSANHDENVFPDPDRIDFHRASNNHLAFGHGVHKCVGMTLARLELEVVYTTLFERLPGLRLAVPLDQVRFKSDDELVYDIHELPVAW
ncbi:cytochrome P450 [Amycolatopsis samaneae]|uniref:Cytochrome P450 n=1 Tax=Amycolatopsis samaneae TaxID=664691 RepID=A0ABW5GBY3_9PSEU